jgi:hypothetical protein
MKKSAVSDERFVVCIKWAHNWYYRIPSGQWAGDHRKAREFSSIEGAMEEAQRIGIVKFMGEACVAHPARVCSYEREGKRQKEAVTTPVAFWTIGNPTMLDNSPNVLVRVSANFQNAIRLDEVDVLRLEDGQIKIGLPKGVAVSKPHFKGLEQALARFLEDAKTSHSNLTV